MTVVGVTGHQHIPPEVTAHIASGIDEVLRSHRGELIGVCSLAAGADQLFAQAVLDMGGALHVIVPCEGYDETFGGSGLSRFRELLGGAELVETLGHEVPTEEAFLDAGHRVADLARFWSPSGTASRHVESVAPRMWWTTPRQPGARSMIVWTPGVTR